MRNLLRNQLHGSIIGPLTNSDQIVTVRTGMRFPLTWIEGYCRRFGFQPLKIRKGEAEQLIIGKLINWRSVDLGSGNFKLPVHPDPFNSSGSASLRMAD